MHGSKVITRNYTFHSDPIYYYALFVEMELEHIVKHAGRSQVYIEACLIAPSGSENERVS